MKRFFFLMAGLLITFSFAFGQKVTEADVPNIVLMTFKTKFINTTNVVWGKDSANYKASFISDELNARTVISDKGAWQESEWEIPIEYTPAKIKDYITANSPDYKITKTIIFEKLDGKSYVVVVSKKKDEQRLHFSLDGEFVEKEAKMPEKKK